MPAAAFFSRSISMPHSVPKAMTTKPAHRMMMSWNIWRKIMTSK